MEEVVRSTCPSRSMKDWITEPETKKEECRPCLLGPIAQWYRDTLIEDGYEDLARKIEEMAESAEPADFCSELDKIKDEVPEELKTRLLDFDCAAQSFNIDSEKEEGGEIDGED